MPFRFGQRCRTGKTGINTYTDVASHYWSFNNAALPGGPDTREIVGQKVSPKIAGVDGLRHLTCGTFIYTAKPGDNERQA